MANKVFSRATERRCWPLIIMHQFFRARHRPHDELTALHLLAEQLRQRAAQVGRELGASQAVGVAAVLRQRQPQVAAEGHAGFAVAVLTAPVLVVAGCAVSGGRVGS